MQNGSSRNLLLIDVFFPFFEQNAVPIHALIARVYARISNLTFCHVIIMFIMPVYKNPIHFCVKIVYTYFCLYVACVL